MKRRRGYEENVWGRRRPDVYREDGRKSIPSFGVGSVPYPEELTDLTREAIHYITRRRGVCGIFQRGALVRGSNFAARDFVKSAV